MRATLEPELYIARAYVCMYMCIRRVRMHVTHSSHGHRACCVIDTSSGKVTLGEGEKKKSRRNSGQRQCTLLLVLLLLLCRITFHAADAAAITASAFTFQEPKMIDSLAPSVITSLSTLVSSLELLKISPTPRHNPSAPHFRI